MGYWVYFPQPASVGLATEAAGTFRTPIDGGHYQMIGNPFPVDATVSVSAIANGRLTVYAYSPETGYVPVSTTYDAARIHLTFSLSAGQAVWCFSAVSTMLSIYPGTALD